MSEGLGEIVVAESWGNTHAGARVGVLALGGVDNPERHEGLDAGRRELEQTLRARFAGQSRAGLAALETIQAYTAFYRRFDKSYHVLAQLESVALKGKPLASATALVQAMFMAEVESQLLTAGHDLGAVEPPISVSAARGDETYVRINGQPQTLKAGDMCMADARGVLSSVLYGPDARTRIRPDTRRVLFVTYAPRGIGDDLLRAHLERIERYVRVVSPAAAREALAIVGG
jgi:DNA/RNA-binding domain of Phe-tRNA-synthetase-like protein